MDATGGPREGGGLVSDWLGPAGPRPWAGPGVFLKPVQLVLLVEEQHSEREGAGGEEDGPASFTQKYKRQTQRNKAPVDAQRDRGFGFYFCFLILL